MHVGVDGKVALITGASHGIARAIAEAFLTSGAKAVAIAGRKVDVLQDVAQQLDPERSLIFAWNVEDDEEIASAITTTIERFGALDVLVNDTATNPDYVPLDYGPLMDTDMAAIDRTWTINQRVPLVAAREAWRQWMAVHGGVIVNVSSLGPHQLNLTLGAYNVSRAALDHLTRQLALELAPSVRVNAVATSVIRSNFSELPSSWNYDAVARTHPLQRLGEPEDIANAVMFLASDVASWVTGHVLAVDGGVTGATSVFGDLEGI